MLTLSGFPITYFTYTTNPKIGIDGIHSFCNFVYTEPKYLMFNMRCIRNNGYVAKKNTSAIDGYASSPNKSSIE